MSFLILAITACDAAASTPALVSNNDISTIIAATFSAAQSQTQDAISVTSSTNKATLSPISTDTPIATDTALPPAPTTAPIDLKGSGDSVINIQKGDQPAIAKIAYYGSGNFAIQNYDDNNTQIDLLVNTIGSYQGTVPLDFMDGEHTTRFQVTASGPWEIQVLPLSDVRHAPIPGQIQGSGDDVIYLDGNNPDTITADASQASNNFVVYSYSENGHDLLINDIAPYTGTVLIDHTTIMVSVLATGKWTLNVTTK